MKEHIDSLKALRDVLVADRRNLVAGMVADPHSMGEGAGDFMNLQQFIDTVERAIGHEMSLERPQGSWPPAPPPGGKGMPRPR